MKVMPVVTITMMLTGVATIASAQQLPPAECGECYARVLIPADYKTEEVRVLIKEESEVVEVTPPEFEWVTEEIEVSPAYTKKRARQVQYRTETIQVVDKPAHTTWKKGKGPFQVIDYGTGEILCRVEVPAKFKKVNKQVVRRTPTIDEVEVPAEFQKVRVKKLKKPAEVKRTKIPAEYATYTKRVKSKDARLDWQAVLCQTNATPKTIYAIQAALKREGYYTGKTSGKLTASVMKAVGEFQAANNLPQGHITISTLKALGVDAPCAGKRQLAKVTGDRIEIMENVYFDTNRATIKTRSFAVLNQVAQVMSNNPSMRVRVEGHTDSRGNASKNLSLSKRRASAVRDYLINNRSIASNRLQSQGYGLEKPVASNDTKEGRSQNRRVDFAILSR